MGEITVSETLVRLLPDEIVVDDISHNARPLYNAESEMEDLEGLAKSMEEDGQLEPILVRPQMVGMPRLIAGRRRIDAAYLINSRKSAKDEPFRLLAMVVQDKYAADKDAFRAAIMENVKRKNLSPIQFALICANVRERESWDGPKQTKKVATYLEVSPATVTTHEKLLTLDKDLQEQVHDGSISAKAAFDLLDVKPEKRGKVLEDAKELSGDGDRAESSVDDEVETTTPKKRKKPVQSKDVRKAIRATEGATEKALSRSRKDIVEWFEMSNGPAYGFEDGPVRQFLTYFMKWASGEGTDRTLGAKFTAAVEKAPKGTPPALEKSEKPSEKRAKEKVVKEPSKPPKVAKKKK